MTYEYVCEVCGHQWEAEQSIKDRPLRTCVSCGEDRAKRLVSGGTGFLLKGGGWYADLYGSPGAGAKNGTDDKAKPNTTAEKSDSGDAKPSTVEAKPSTTEKSASSGSSAGSTASTAPSPTKTSATSAAKAS